MLERPESLTHLAELAKRRIQLVGLRMTVRCLLGRTPVATPKIENDKQSSNGNEDDESRYHSWMIRGRRDDCSSPGRATARIRLLLCPAFRGSNIAPSQLDALICQTSPLF